MTGRDRFPPAVLIRWISLRRLLGDRSRMFLATAGVALGVAVFISIRLANYSAMASFRDTVDAVAGRSNLQIQADSQGFDAAVYDRVRKVPGVLGAAPVVQAYALGAVAPTGRSSRVPARGSRQKKPARPRESLFGETLLVLGLDPAAEAAFQRYPKAKEPDRRALLAAAFDPRPAAVTRAFANRHRLREGSPLTLLSGGMPVEVTVRYILDVEELQQVMAGNVVVLPLPVAQRYFNRRGRLDRIDLLVDESRMPEVRKALATLLPPNTEVLRPEQRSGQVENMVRAFSLNLTALSFIALFVSMFLIFNAVSLSVLLRRREIGLLRTVGVTRSQIVLQFLGEAAVIGFIGSIAGLGLGTLLARVTLRLVGRSITELYLVQHTNTLAPDPAAYAIAFAVGMGISLLSGLAPAVEASGISPAAAVRQGLQIEARRLPIAAWTAAGFLTLALSAAVAWFTVFLRQPLAGFASGFLILIGFSLLSPVVTLGSARLFQPLVFRLAGLEGLLGARYLKDSLARTSLLVAGLMVSVGMTVGLTVMVGSFRQTISVWVNQTLRGDLYVEPVGRRVTGSATVLPPSVVEAARSVPGASGVDTYRSIRIHYGRDFAFIAAIDFEIQEQLGRLVFLRGGARAVIGRALREDGVVVTESFAHRHRVREGDLITLQPPSGPARLRVEGIFYDYSTDTGAILMDRLLFQRLWKDDRTESLAIYLRPGSDPHEARRAFLALVTEPVLLKVIPSAELRRGVLEVFDQTFLVTYALQAIAVLVALLGVVSSLTALVLQRGREIGVLRAVGATRGQVRKIVLVESCLLGLTAALLGCVCGLALAVLLVFVINKEFFGWSIQLVVDPWLFPQIAGLLVLTAAVAGLPPANLAAKRVPAEAMRVE